MKNFTDFISAAFQSVFMWFCFWIGILWAFWIVWLLALNKLLPIINKFLGTL